MARSFLRISPQVNRHIKRSWSRVALNEVCVPHQTGGWLQPSARERFDLTYAPIQQSKTSHLATVEAESILTCYPILETANLDDQAHGMVAQVARMAIDDQCLRV